MAVIGNFTRDVIITCGDDVITMSIDEDHVVVRIVEPCSSLRNVSTQQPFTFTAYFSTASVSQLQRLFYSPLVWGSERVWGRPSAPSPNFFGFWSPNSDFWCIVGAIFTVQWTVLDADNF